VNCQCHQRDHLPVFAVGFQISIGAVNLLKIPGYGIEYCLVIRRTDPWAVTVADNPSVSRFKAIYASLVTVVVP
jgi:hypothetical protein